MRRILSLTAAAAVLALGAGVAPALSRSPLDLARRAAAARHTVVVVDFYTDWCGWCRVLDRSVYPDPAVRRQLDRTVFLHLDAEGEGADAARRYRVDGFPTVVFLAADGREIGRIRGLFPAAEFAEQSRRILESR